MSYATIGSIPFHQSGFTLWYIERMTAFQVPAASRRSETKCV